MNKWITYTELEMYDTITKGNTLPEPYNNAGEAMVVGISKHYVTFLHNRVEWKEKKTYIRNGVVRDNHCELLRKYPKEIVVKKVDNGELKCYNN